MKWLTIGIPAYNEEKNIIPLIGDIIRVLEPRGIDYMIFVINDGSTDNTEQLINTHFLNNPRIVIHNHPVNLGFGPTIRDCFTLPDSEWIMNVSGDNQFPAENIAEMIKFTDTHDVILGYRINRSDNSYRILISLVYNRIISILARKKIHDVSSILLVKKSLLFNETFKSKSGFIHSEIALKALRKSASYTEVELLHTERMFGKASGGKFKTIIYTIFEMIKYIFGLL